MPEIGATLRETRMRARIDISEIEAETKIRAKYLRALENEEWDLLPGPTYVKTFLRTYAEALGLDARLLVEEYKLRHERISDQDLSRPIGAAAAGRKRPDRPGWSTAEIAAACVVALLIGIFVLGKLGGGKDDKGSSSSSTPATSSTPTTAAPATGTKKPATATTTPASSAKPQRKTVRLTLVATAPLYVCLRASGDRTLVRGETLSAGERRGPFNATSYTMNLGNTNVRLRIDGKTVKVPASSGAVGLRVSKRGRTPLPAGQRPECR